VVAADCAALKTDEHCDLLLVPVRPLSPTIATAVKMPTKDIATSSSTKVKPRSRACSGPAIAGCGLALVVMIL